MMNNYKESFERIKKFTKLIADVPVASLRQRSELIKDLEAIEEALKEYSKLKDKIENKTLIELPYVNNVYKYNKHLGKEVNIFNIFYKDNYGDIAQMFCLSPEEVEIKLEELQGKE